MTINGPKTVDQMNAELRAAGWPGPPAGTEGAGATANAYARTAGGTVTEMAGQNYAAAAQPPGSVTTPGTSVNPTMTQQILNDAQQKAYQAYLNARLQLDNDTLAFNKATEAFNETITQAGLTGTYQGAPTQAALQFAATNFGTWGMPTQGQQTLAAQNQAFTQQQALASMYGQYYAPGQTPTSGMQTQAAQQQAYTQWLQGQQQALAQWQAQQGAAQSYLNMMAGLRGPADWAQYQKVLGATPQGMQDLVRAAAGQYIPGGGATTGVGPQPITLGGFVNQTTGPADTANQAAMNSLVAPNQMAPQTWNALTPSQQQMLLGAWENQGYTQEDAKALFTQSLPKYATGAPSSGSFKLQ
jgi:hypothetical protein